MPTHSTQLPDRPPVRCSACGRNLGLTPTKLRIRGRHFCATRRRCRLVYVTVRKCIKAA